MGTFRERAVAKLQTLGDFCKNVFSITTCFKDSWKRRHRALIAAIYGESFIKGSLRDRRSGYSRAKELKTSYVKGEPGINFDYVTAHHPERKYNIFHWPSYIFGAIRSRLLSWVDAYGESARTVDRAVDIHDYPSSRRAVALKFVISGLFSLIEVPIYISCSMLIGDTLDLIFSGCCGGPSNVVELIELAENEEKDEKDKKDEIKLPSTPKPVIPELKNQTSNATTQPAEPLGIKSVTVPVLQIPEFVQDVQRTARSMTSMTQEREKNTKTPTKTPRPRSGRQMFPQLPDSLRQTIDIIDGHEKSPPTKHKRSMRRSQSMSGIAKKIMSEDVRRRTLHPAAQVQFQLPGVPFSSDKSTTHISRKLISKKSSAKSTASKTSRNKEEKLTIVLDTTVSSIAANTTEIIEFTPERPLTRASY